MWLVSMFFFIADLKHQLQRDKSKEIFDLYYLISGDEIETLC